MTKKHFDAFANLIKHDIDLDKHIWVGDQLESKMVKYKYSARTFAILAKQFNSKFDERKFFKACGLDKNQ